MKNTFGNALSVTLFGESHGECTGCVLDGLAPGIEIDEQFINERLFLRRPDGYLTTARTETDEFKIVSGIYNNKTTGTPLTIIISNKDVKRTDYESDCILPRPSHADYTGYIKYNGFNDKDGGGHFSGRITAPLVAASGIILPVLEKNSIRICSHIKKIGTVTDRSFEDFEKDFVFLKGKRLPVFSDEAAEKIKTEVLKAKENGDSVGGIIETAVTGIPAGLGEPWFDTVEGMISHIIFSVPAIKGIEFGSGFDLTEKFGSEANDQIEIKNGNITFLSNNMGGIDGGITNGNPLVFRCAVKPTPTVFKEQKTVNLNTQENCTIKAKGRHDPCIALRISPVIDSVTSLCIYDMLSQKYGTDWAVK